MAMSKDERERRYRIIHVLDNSSWRRADDEDTVNTPTPVDEAADTRMKDLDDIEIFLNGKSLPYLGSESMGRINSDMVISLFFMSNKSVTVSPSKNLIRFGIGFDRDSVQVSSSYENQCSLEKFIGLPKKVDSPDFKSVSEITSLCNADEIYNIYKPRALEIIKMRLPTAYNMFTGSNISHYRVTKGDVWWTKYGVQTLAVTFDQRFKKFLYMYYPEFILECALDEWSLNKKSYTSFKDCYCYILAFMISHEMLHIIHHNSTSTIDMGDVGGHRIVNIIQDNFINCKISQMFRGVDGISDRYSNAPMPRAGVGSSITVRAEHNVGFKKYDTTKDLAAAIVHVISVITKKEEIEKSFYMWASEDIGSFAGADVFITLDVKPELRLLRDNSALFQKMVNEVVKTITDGRVYDQFSKLTDAEKATDKPVLANGTLVQVKGSNIICSVNGYDEDTKEYDLLETEISRVDRVLIEPGLYQCTSVYSPTKPFGRRRRAEIRPFDPSDNSWVEADGERDKKTKLSGEDLASLTQDDNKTGLNVVDRLVGIVGKDMVIELLGTLLDANNLSDIKDPADVLVDAVHGMSEDDCRNHLGDILYKELIDREEVLMKLGSMAGNMDTGAKSAPNDGSVFHVGDIVWVKRKRKFGRIVSMSDGMFELEEMEEIGVRVLDDSDSYEVSEGAPRMVLKERVFKPTGNMLGKFPAFDLETFDIEYTESNIDNSSDGDSGEGKTTTVPPPRDDNPLEPESSEKDNSKSSSKSGGQSGGQSGSEDDSGDNDIPDEWDIEGEDIDDEDPYTDDMEDGYGDSDDSSTASSGDSSGDSDNSGDSSDGSDNSGDSSGGGDDSSDEEDSVDGSGDMSDFDNDLDDDFDDDGSGASGGSGDSSESDRTDDDSDESDSGKPGEQSGSKSGSKDNMSGDSDSDSGNNSGESVSYDEWDPGIDEGESIGSELAKALDKIESEESESSKQRRTNEEERDGSSSNGSDNDSGSGLEASPEEVKAARDMLGKAIKDARQDKHPNSMDSYRSDGIDETDVLGSMGAGSLTSVFVPNAVSDWKRSLEKILDRALGFDIVTNPNLVNKKLEDAPPGREDEVPDIKNVAVLLDCSSSMGADKFKQVIQHIDTMLAVRKMDKTNFHIIDWGEGNLNRILRSYVKVKGKVFRREIMTHKANQGSTNIIPAFVAISQRVKKPDAIIILTDADIFDSGDMRSDNGKIAADFIKKNRHKIIWVVAKFVDSRYAIINRIDPTAMRSHRIIKFKGD